MKLKHRLRVESVAQAADSAGAGSVVWAHIRSERHDVDADCTAINPGSGAAWRWIQSLGDELAMAGVLLVPLR